MANTVKRVAFGDITNIPTYTQPTSALLDIDLVPSALQFSAEIENRGGHEHYSNDDIHSNVASAGSPQDEDYMPDALTGSLPVVHNSEGAPVSGSGVEMSRSDLATSAFALELARALEAVKIVDEDVPSKEVDEDMRLITDPLLIPDTQRFVLFPIREAEV